MSKPPENAASPEPVELGEVCEPLEPEVRDSDASGDASGDASQGESGKILVGLPLQSLDAEGEDRSEQRRAREKARDLALVQRVKDGDESAFAEILDLYQGRVFRLVRRIWQREIETAEDLTQEVFLRVFRGIFRFEGTSAFSTWLHRIAVNVCITEIRSRKALKRDRPTFSLDAPVAGGGEENPLRIEPEARAFDPGEQMETREMFEACRNAIEGLPSMWRMILQLRDLEEKSYEEISEILDLPIGTVRSRLHRARARVRSLLEGGGR